MRTQYSFINPPFVTADKGIATNTRQRLIVYDMFIALDAI